MFPSITAYLHPPTSYYGSLVWFFKFFHLTGLFCPLTSRCGSLAGFLRDFQPSPPTSAHQRIGMTRWWVSSMFPLITTQLHPPTSYYDSLVRFLELFHPRSPFFAHHRVVRLVGCFYFVFFSHNRPPFPNLPQRDLMARWVGSSAIPTQNRPFLHFDESL